MSQRSGAAAQSAHFSVKRGAGGQRPPAWMKRGFGLIEIILAVCILAVVCMVLLSATSSSIADATRTRGEILADELMRNLIEETHAHPYGSDQGWWGQGKQPRTVDLNVIVEGRKVATSYTLSLKSANDRGGNGSFYTPSSLQDYDVLELTIDWEEGTEASSAGVRKSRSIYLTVWRQGALAE